jgi:ubiquinol-cytochrome c reductase cytochrome b subunit
VHDILGVSVFLMAFSAVIFFAPEMGGYFLEFNNFIPADPLKTPAAHRAGLVLHAVLLDPAGDHRGVPVWGLIPFLLVYLAVVWLSPDAALSKLIAPPRSARWSSASSCSTPSSGAWSRWARR